MHAQNDFRSKLLDEDLYDLNISLYVEKMKAKDNILIWGAGQSVYDFLDAYQMSENVKYFADNNKLYGGTKKEWLLVYTRGSFEKVERFC